ncbi:hypothetical protein [Jiella avicenniae]|uniref:Uncharacterized protein n=1 Tax=Jiella avicenniae TaxID=2907202 RepID=A0A9X1T6M1_9HYPH|nr:hypothetical protein [Jiella avicenniae]MCE7030761.1 hypothetical protein [Jiella avicenniae]
MAGVGSLAFGNPVAGSSFAARAARGLARALTALAVAATVWSTLGSDARAAGSDDTLALIEERLRDTVADVVTRNCIGPEEARPYTVTFYGLPIADPHFSANDRQRINQLVLTGLREARRVAVDVSAAGDAGALAPIAGLGSPDQNQLATALDRLGSSTLPIVLKASRPEPGVARIDLSVFARGAGGAYGCNRSIAFNLALDSLEPRPDSRSSRDYLTLEGAYSLALQALAPRLKSASGVYVKGEKKPDCAFLDRAVERFQDSYYGTGQMDFGAGRVDRDLPDLLLGEPAADGDAATLELAFTVPDQPDDTLDILASLQSRGRLLSRQRFSVAAETEEFDACREKPQPVVARGSEDPQTSDAPGTVGAGADDRAEAPRSGEGGNGAASDGASDGRPPKVAGTDGSESGVSTDPTPRADGTIPTVPVPVTPGAGDGSGGGSGSGPDLAAVEPEPEPIAAPEPPACREDGEILDFLVAPSVGRTGDRLALRALVRQCTPAFFGFGAGKVTPIPVEIFETSDASGGATSYEASPRTRKKLVLQDADPLGLNKIVLFCSSCVAKPTSQDVVGWLRNVRDMLESDRRSATATLPGGVGYAFGSVEKVN